MLFHSGGGELPAVGQIAAAAGLAKGTVYLHLRTKEEIFITLLLRGLAALLNEIAVTFQTASGPQPDQVRAFLTMYLKYFDRYPELLRLDGLGYGVLEKNLSFDQRASFKHVFATKLAETGIIIEAALKLSPGRGSCLS